MNNSTFDLQEIVWHDVDWIVLAQNRDMWLVLVYMLMKFVFRQKGEIFQLTAGLLAA